MSLKLFINLIFLLFIGSLIACTSIGKKQTPSHEELDGPQVQVQLMKELHGGLKSLKNKKVKAVIFYNQPDVYLLKERQKQNSEDFAFDELVKIQNERVEMLNQALATVCDECKDFEVLNSAEVLKTQTSIDMMTNLIKHSDPKSEDIKKILSEIGGADYLWILTGNEDVNQKRLADQEKAYSSSAKTIYFKSLMYEATTNNIVQQAVVVGADEEMNIYKLIKDNVSAVEIFKKLKNSLKFVKGDELIGEKNDKLYPFPPVPQTSVLMNKAFVNLLEVLNPEN